MRHYGDITKIKGNEVPITDVVCFGAPCQDLSQAGLRKGMKHTDMGDEETTRSGLFHDAVRVIKEMRTADAERGNSDVDIRPRYGIYENVPGAFSSNKGLDFQAVLHELVKVAEPEAPPVPVPEKGWPLSGCLFDELGKWSVCWRVLDAQYWGLPQRRRRICLVCDFNGLNAPKIVFGEAEHNRSTKRGGGKSSVGYSGGDSRPKVQSVTESVSGNLEPSEPKRKATARDAESGIGTDDRVPYTMKIRSGVETDSSGRKAGKGALIQTDKSGCLNTVQDQYLFQPMATGFPLGFRPENVRCYEETATTLCNGTRPGFTTGVIQTKVYGISPYHSNSMKSDNPNSGVYEAETSRSLDAMNCGYPGCNQGGMAVVQPMAISLEPGIAAREGGHIYEGVSGTLRAKAGDNQMSVAYSLEHHPQDSRINIDESGMCQTLTSRMGTGGGNVPMVLEPKVYESHPMDSRIKELDGVSPTVSTKWHKGSADTPLVMEPVTYQQVTGPLMANSHPGSYTGQDAYNDMLIASPVEHQEKKVRHIVRRLTPLECERLQGFPDGWTDIGEWVDSKGKKHKEADSPRYKALGNSIALPPWKWVLKRLCACYERDATMASLFDGIGGFPLIWEQLNGKGSCLWASEIEEFCVAVTKKRFGD